MSKNTAHAPVKIKCIKWSICRKCGLIYLKNEATRKAIKKVCPGTSDD